VCEFVFLLSSRRAKYRLWNRSGERSRRKQKKKNLLSFPFFFFGPSLRFGCGFFVGLPVLGSRATDRNGGWVEADNFVSSSSKTSSNPRVLTRPLRVSPGLKQSPFPLHPNPQTPPAKSHTHKKKETLIGSRNDQSFGVDFFPSIFLASCGWRGGDATSTQRDRGTVFYLAPFSGPEFGCRLVNPPQAQLHHGGMSPFGRTRW